MNARSAVFSYVAFRPSKIRDLLMRLPYEHGTIYSAVEDLISEGLLSKGNDGILRVSPDYRAQKQRELYVKALSHGVDPEQLLRESTIKVIRAIQTERTLAGIQQETSLSKKWISTILSFLEKADLVEFRQRRPIHVVMNPEHELTSLLTAIIDQEESDMGIDTFYTPGSAPFDEQLLDGMNLEKVLFEKIDDGLAVKNTGFIVRGDRFRILENVNIGSEIRESGVEGFFLHRILTPKGVEDDCIRLIAQGKLKYDNLLELAMKNDMVAIVGCYLEIVNDIRPFLSPDIISLFYRQSKRSSGMRGSTKPPSKKPRSAKPLSARPPFLEGEKRYGKAGWERPSEEKWGVDLYLDIGAIRHGVRAA